MPALLAKLATAIRRSPGEALVFAGLFVALAVTPVIFDPNIYDNFTLPKQASLMVAMALILTGLAIRGEFLPRNRALRIAVLAWILWSTLAFLLGIDRRGSIFGFYQYRQGYVTRMAYVALFLGAMSVARDGHERRLFFAGLLGLAGAAGYTLVQSAGLDPIHWWIDTSERAIGTIGNANELASYAVIAAGMAGAMAGLPRRWGLVLAAGVAATVAFTVLESQSRSGLVACALIVVVFPSAAALRHETKGAVAGQAGVLIGGALVGIAISAFTGGASGTADRVQAGISTTSTTDSRSVTRVQLWRGAAAVVEASPVWGFGPDSLPLTFPRYRPGNLGGAFADYDLVVQSSHNLLLDVAASSGVVGLAALFALLAVVGWRSLATRREAATDAYPYIWSAIAGYLALCLLNPISIAAHAAFFVFLGILGGRAEMQAAPARPVRDRRALMLRIAAVAPAAAGLVAGAILLRVADSQAEAGWGLYASGRVDEAAHHYRRATGLMPLERSYAHRQAEAWLAAGATGDRSALVRSERVYEAIQADFGLSSTEAMGLATARIGLGRPTATILPIIDMIREFNPHGVTTDSYSATLREAAERGGTLQFTTTDLWVSVRPDDPAATH